MKKDKIWFCLSISLIALALAGMAILTIIIDPLFHYHKPLKGMQYYFDNQRYQNDGITRHFEYDAIITGTSMTENFKASLVDELWGTQSIKIPFSGARYKEINDATKRAIDRNEEIKFVIRGLDLFGIILDKDEKRYDIIYPEYLYDDNISNDVHYVLNKEIFVKNVLVGSMAYTLIGKQTQNFDEYGNWMDDYPNWGKEVVMTYPKLRLEKENISEEGKKIIKENIEQNVVALARENPDVEFLLFYPPYSIAYFDSIGGGGVISQQMNMMKYATELMLEHENIKIFSFFDEYDMVCDLNNYKDSTHYSEYINDKILYWMKNEEHLLTKENYIEHYVEIEKFYANFDYDEFLWDDIS